MRKSILSFAVASFGLAHGAIAEEAVDAPIGMITPGGPHYECGQGWATPIALRDLIANIDKWVGRCVRVRGITRSHFLYADLPDYYRRYNLTKDQRGPGMGMYEKTALQGKRLLRYRQAVEVVAMAYTCKRYWDWARQEVDRKNADEKRRAALRPDGEITERIPWVSGYCHYTLDPVLFVSEVRVIDKGPVRLVGAAAAAEYGDLEVLPAGAPEYTEVRSRLVEWFDALRRRDGQALVKLTADAKPEDLNDKDGWLHKLLNARDSGARFLFSRRTLPQMHLMRAKLSQDYYAFGCLCKGASCGDRWPIHSADAIIDDAWPYACTWVHRVDGKYLVSD